MTLEEKQAKRKAYLAIWREQNREKTREAQRKYYEANKTVCNTRVLEARAKKREAYNEYAAQWRETNKERVSASRRAWYVKNSAKDILRVRKRQQRIKQVPPWLTQAHLAEIDGLYLFCQLFKGFEVDHIIPLNGKQVSGLHVPENLQVLTVRANRQKGATF